MLLSACPQCAMPRAEADIAKGPCPLCGYVAGQTVAPHVDEPPLPVVVDTTPLTPVAREKKTVGWAYAAGISIAVAGGLLMGQYVFPVKSPTKTVEVKTTVAVEVAAKTTAPLTVHIPPAPSTEVAPFPREVEEIARPPVKPTVALPGGVSLIRLNRPDEVYTMERIGEGNSIKLVGKVSKLVVSGVDGGATLDATELQVKTISFNGKIEGNAKIKVISPNGTISFSKAIGGNAQIEAFAPGGSVAFASPGATIAGGAKLRITGKSVWFHTKIEGGSFVEVIVSKAGSLKFFELAGGSKIHYRSEIPNDEARISPGRMDDSSECKRLD